MLLRRANKPAARPHLDLVIDQDLCYSCGACVAVCPPDALFLRDIRLTVDQATCTDCNRCVAMCPVHALSLIPHEGRIAS
ncbi:MAG: Electron transport complex subunit RsxB [Anaerolineae bacterium]|jgi:ferredoxin|nr:MAG: ferredoxin [Chloroflexi bacterium OLB13]MBV6436176.1 Electron transport complex subunit RsxB [Anaerolineae bacterium]OQY78997.1 MAG: hypothetical protein B6D42_15745 [Anaerolineae bacterium UTCFX5]